ncbi:hypothetical protein CONLIGDRAFT_686914 [Coniochaeta ligniaria NRRL 30616]|uniref:Uncharacterized protein n=1 Tax=Coniochaeta ligniaria NRRL 30616 TaxID=1408157 RepID=A0A1J7I683_9PEZI|nr:hypothetical protein CONLIGDRAFT_686914 [Coniochaeta ligniaria NRRL 30616]
MAPPTKPQPPLWIIHARLILLLLILLLSNLIAYRSGLASCASRSQSNLQPPTATTTTLPGNATNATNTTCAICPPPATTTALDKLIMAESCRLHRNLASLLAGDEHNRPGHMDMDAAFPADLSLSLGQAHPQPQRHAQARFQARNSPSSSDNTNFYPVPPRLSSSSDSSSSGSTENAAADDGRCGCGFVGEWGASNEWFVLMAEVDMFLAMEGVCEGGDV